MGGPNPGDRPQPVTSCSVAAAAAAAAPAATTAAPEGRLHGGAVHGEGGDLLQDVGRVARGARHDLVVAADELVEVLLALHARVFVDRHGPSVLSRPGGAMDDTDARGRGSCGSSRSRRSTRTTSGRRRAILACGAGCPIVQPRDRRRLGGVAGRRARAQRRRRRARVRDRPRRDGTRRRLDPVPRAATRAPEPRDRLDVARALCVGHGGEHRGEAAPAPRTPSRRSAAVASSSRPMRSTSARAAPSRRSRPRSRGSTATTCSSGAARAATPPGIRSWTRSGRRCALRSKHAWPRADGRRGRLVSSGDDDSCGLQDVPAVRGHVRAAARDRGRDRAADPRRRGGSVLAGLHLPEGIDPRLAARGSRPPAPAARPPRRRARRGELGRGLRRGRATTHAAARGTRPRRRGGLLRQPERAQLRQLPGDQAAREGARDEERLLGLDRRSDAQARLLRARLRSPADDPRARHRPHRPAAPPRRQPARVERQPRDGARLARPPRRRSAPAAAASSSSTRAGREPPSRPTCTCESARAPTPRSSRVSPTLSSPRASPAPARSPRSSTASRRSRRQSPASRPERVSAYTGVPAETIAGAGTRARSRPDRSGVRPHRDAHDRLRDPRRVARRRAQRDHRQPRPAGRGDVPTCGARAAAPPAARLPHRPLAQPRPRPTRGDGRAARLDPRRRDRDSRGRAGAGAADRRRQPRADDARRRTARPAAGRARADGERRPVPERDDAPRRRDPAAALGAREGALRPRLHRAVRAKRGPLLAARCSGASPEPRPSSRSSSAWRPSPAASVPAPTPQRWRP